MVDLRVYIDWKWKNGKNISCKQKPKVSRSIYSKVGKKIACKLKTVKETEKDIILKIKGLIHQEDLLIFVAQTSELLSIWGSTERRNSNTILTGDFNTPLSAMNGTTRMKINKEIQNLNFKNSKDQLILTYIYGTLHLTTYNINYFQMHLEPSAW